MSEYSRPLGDAVKRARGKLNMTQGEVANAINKDTRTVLNIENYKGNPKMEVLYPLIRVLQIDAREIFNHEITRDNPSIEQLQLFVGQCTEQEAETILPILQAALAAIRKTSGYEIK